MFYDLVFLVLFSLFIGIFLFKNRKRLEREGIMYLYRTKLGMKYIEKFSRKYSRLLKVLAPIILVLGFFLMFVMLALLYQTVKIYVTIPEITEVISAPPVMPLIPYFPQIFGVESLMPPFYFTYFLLALIIVAVVHEFSHGIFMRLYKIKIKSTGFAFLGPILGAFVEEDKKNFSTKNPKERMVVLGAGVFANLITGLLFFALLVGFFQLAYVPAGYNFNVYATSNIQSQFLEDLNLSSTNFSSVEANNMTLFFNEKDFQITTLGVLKSINGQNVSSYKEMRSALSNKSVNETVLVEIEMNKKTKLYSFNLFAHPTRNGEVSLGLGNVIPPRTTFKEKLIGLFANYKDPTISYQEKFSSADFFYNLLWWIMIINFLVALFNMLPLGILDGGQFYQLAILSVVKSEKISAKIILWTKKLIAFAFFLMMFFWLKNLIF
jgi:membrane-associated protease RseP (regulator of RpoE activity)